MIQNNRSGDIYYRFGQEKFGPFLYGFTRWLKKRFDTRNYDKVFFFSRDGYMMKKAFDIVDEGKTNSEYVYFSRKSLRQALLWKTDSLDETLQYLGWERYVSVGKILEYFGFNEEERKSIAKEHSCDLNRDIPFDGIKKDQEINALYQLKKAAIKENSKTQSELLLKYIDQIGMRGKCAIVDIGWHGSMQYFLELFLKEHKIEAEIDGYYVGIAPNVPLKSKVYGYVYNDSEDTNRKKMLCFFGGYERLFQGFQGSTNGYKYNDDGRVEPLLARYEYEGTDDADIVERIKAWQTGATDYIKEGAVQNSSLSDEELISPLIRFGISPKLSDVRVFKDFYTYDGSKRYFVCEKKLGDYRLKEFLHELSNSQWKTGFLKSAFRIPFPYYWIYKIIRK